MSVEDTEQEIAYPEYNMDWNQFQSKSFSKGYVNFELSVLQEPDPNDEFNWQFSDLGYFDLLSQGNNILTYSVKRNLRVFDLSLNKELFSFHLPRLKGWDGIVINKGHLDGNHIFYPVLFIKDNASNPEDSRLYCGDINTGEVIWSKELDGLYGTDVCGGKSTLYFANYRGLVSAINKSDGSVIWESRIEDKFTKKPILTEGTLLLIGASGTVYRLHISDGSLIETIKFGNIIRELNVTNDCAPVINKDYLFFVDGENRLNCFNTFTKELYFSFNTNTDGNLNILKYRNDIIIHSDTGYIALIDTDSGKPRWIQDFNAPSAPLQFLYGNTLYVTAGNELVLLHADTGRIVEKINLNIKFASAMIPGPSGLLILSPDGTLIQAVGEEGDFAKQNADLSLLASYYTISENEDFSIGLGDETADLFFTAEDDGVYSIILDSIDVNLNIYSDDNLVTSNFDGTENVRIIKVRFAGGKKYRFEIEKLNKNEADFIFSIRVRKNEV